MIPSVAMLYGPYAQHPWREDMFHRPDMIQAALHQLGFGFDIAVVTQPPSGNDEIPDVRIARNPIYDPRTGVLQNAHFMPGTIEDYPSIIDHWVDNFKHQVFVSEDTYEFKAYGIGLPPERLWNHKKIQAYGNRKDLMDALIVKHGVGIDTWNVQEYDKLHEQYPRYKVIYKPLGDAQAKGIRIFETVKDVKNALSKKTIMSNGLIQPYLNVFHPLNDLIPASSDDAVLLKELNAKRNRPREIRMHVITTTDESGELQTEAYPIIKVSKPNVQFMQADYDFIVGLDPACLSKGSFIHDKSVELAQAVCKAAGEPGRPIPQYYGVFDWLVEGDVNDPTAVRVVDGNCRGPGLVEKAVAARDAFQRALARSGKQVLDDHANRNECSW
jgi:hypothetical protein